MHPLKVYFSANRASVKEVKLKVYENRMETMTIQLTMVQDKFGGLDIISQDCIVKWCAVTEVGLVAESI